MKSRHHIVVLDETRRVTYTMQTPITKNPPLTNKIVVEPGEKKVFLYDQKEVTAKHYGMFNHGKLSIVACSDNDQGIKLPVPFEKDNTELVPAITLTKPFVEEATIEYTYE